MLKDVTKRFQSPTKSGEVIATDKISFKAEEGTLLTLLGPSGCGKTTALRMIAGFEFPDSGEIYIGDEIVNDIPPNKRDTAMVFQSYALFPHLSIFENVAYGLRVEKMAFGEIKKKVSEILNKVGLEGVEGRSPSQLSGGQQQRVALARVLVKEPKVLLFDEPLSNLDAKLREHMRKEIKSLQKRLGITTIYVTHDQVEAMTLSDKVVVMNKGRIEQIGTPQEIYEKPQTQFVADFIGKANFLDAEVKEFKEKEVTVLINNTNIVIKTELKDLKGGEKILLVIRPEAVEILSKSQANFSGRIRRRIYLGSEVEYEIEFQGKILVAYEKNPKSKKVYEEDEEVGINFTPECIHILR